MPRTIARLPGQSPADPGTKCLHDDDDTFEALTQSGARTAIDPAGRYPLPNLIGIMENLMENTSPPMRVSRKTLLELYRRASNHAAALDNPHEFATTAVGFMKSRLADQLVDGIRYEKIDEWYEMIQFEAEIETWADYIVPSVQKHGAGGTHVHDDVPIDSETIEKPFIEALEKRKDIKLYIKLLSWFTIATPIGEYNPDGLLPCRPGTAARTCSISCARRKER